MTASDPVGDMLARIRNALMIRRTVVQMPSSRLKVAIAQVLREEGYVKDYQVNEEGVRKNLRIELQFTPNKEPVLMGLKRMSRPGLRFYASADRIPRVYGGLGVAILSTSKGVISGERARELQVGGEVLCRVW